MGNFILRARYFGALNFPFNAIAWREEREGDIADTNNRQRQEEFAELRMISRENTKRKNDYEKTSTSRKDSDEQPDIVDCMTKANGRDYAESQNNQQTNQEDCAPNFVFNFFDFAES